MSLHYSIGKSKRPALNDCAMNKIVPGPGQYTNKYNTAKSSPNWGFGSSKRPALNKKSGTDRLGPGQYQIPSKIVEGPQFVMGAANHDPK